MAGFAQLGNDLYTGKRSVDFIGHRRIWFGISIVLLLIAIVVPFIRGGFVFGIEFVGGSEFRVTGVTHADQQLARTTVQDVVPAAEPTVTTIGDDALRIQTFRVTQSQSATIVNRLASAYKVPHARVSASYINASWGGDITASAVKGLIIFLLLAMLGMSLYFRTWKMSLAAILALLHDLVITCGFYGVFGIEITPAAVIGLLTILGYSLYDTVVVFDKIRENTAGFAEQRTRTFSELVNLAVNQTLIRSLNTSVVALLPVASILFIGSAMLGASTLEDISVALFVGILVGAYSSVFIASPLYAMLRSGEEPIREHRRLVLDERESLAVAER